MQTLTMRFILTLWLAAPLCGAIPAKQFLKPPKLAVVIVIDQLRPDQLTRYRSELLPDSPKKRGGFQFLMQNSAYFPFGEYRVLQNMTGPGHSMIATGSYPYQNGIATNNFFDRISKKKVYCAEDPFETFVGAKQENPRDGTSPRNLFGTTMGDELKNSGLPSRVVSIAIKDRSAIFMGGHRADQVLWFDKHSFRWVTSTYYQKEGPLPEWIESLNRALSKKKTMSIESPFGIEMTFDAAIASLEPWRLGNGKATDLLMISLSSHDYVGHDFGPSSPEIRQMILAEDKLLAKFFATLEKRVPGGLSETVIALTSDHGIPPLPGQLADHKVSAGRISEDPLEKDIEKHLDKHFGPLESGKWVEEFVEFNLYLNESSIISKKLTKSAVELAIKEYLLSRTREFAQVVTSTEVKQGHFPPGQFRDQGEKSYFPLRSGDLIIIPRPFFMPGKDTVNHITGYAYDRTVPILFYGKNVKKGVYETPVEVVQIAPTITFLAGSTPPALSEGKVLPIF